MLRIKIAFLLIGGFFIVGSVFAQNEPAYLESNQEQIDFEESIIEEEQALEQEEMIESEEFIQDEMVEEETDLQNGNKGYVYYSSAEPRLEKERKEGISPWRLIKKADDWIKKNLW